MRATLIYDGECPLCQAAREWIERRAMPEEFDYVACQSPERAERFPGVSEAQCMEAMQLVTPEGEVYAGADALPRILERLKGWRWLAKVLRLPVVSALSPHAYRFIAKRRHAFAVVVAHKSRPGEKCPAEDEGS